MGEIGVQDNRCTGEQRDEKMALGEEIACRYADHGVLSPGIVRAPLLTTLMQVASRLLLVWGIAYPFPQSTAHSPAFAGMLLAWSVTEVIRYSYFVFLLGSGKVPAVLSWLRYNTFYVLYPLGISCECWLVYKATGPAAELNPLIAYGLWAVLAIYVPGMHVFIPYLNQCTDPY